jgi:hypothetical protein
MDLLLRRRFVPECPLKRADLKNRSTLAASKNEQPENP